MSSDLRCSPHLHVLALDGVFAEEPEGPPTFVPLPALGNADVADVLATLRAQTLRLLERRGVIERDPATDGLAVLPSDAANTDPVMAQLAAAAASGSLPAGPERRERPPLHLVPDAEARTVGALCAADSGFTLHAATTARRDDAQGKEALARYLLRPPLAQGRVKLLADGMVRISLKLPFGDRTTAIDLDPLSLLCRLAASVRAPKFHTIRYGGVLAPGATWREAVAPEPPPEEDADAEQRVAAMAGHRALGAPRIVRGTSF